MKRVLSIVLNLFVFVMTFVAWGVMVFQASDGGPLSAGGLFSLKFFTVLSNVFNALVCLVYALRLLKNRPVTVELRTWKLTSTAAVGLTFLTVAGFFGPAFGYAFLYLGPNFWMHLTLPVLSILSFALLERGPALPFRKTLWAIVPMVVYGAGYLGNVLIRGVGEWPDRHDFYGFLTWGWPVGIAIAVALALATWGLAVLLWRVSGAVPATKKTVDKL